MGAAMSKKHFQRFNNDFEPCEQGRQFIDAPGHVDVSGLNVLYSSIDTVRQLYNTHLDLDFVESLANKLAEEGFDTKIYSFYGYDWVLRRGGQSGYKYLLQNSELGLILLIKNHKAKLDCVGAHLKIEVSPKLIVEHSPSSLQYLLDEIAFLVSYEGNFQSSGCAIHLAIDFQGWEPPARFNESLTCRSRRVTNRDGLSELFLDNDICSVHGKGQSYLFGSATTLQLAVYNKTKEAKASDKMDFMKSMWSKKTTDFLEPLYQPEIPVWRVELRFSHSVIRQFSDMNVDAPKTDSEPLNVSRLTTFQSLIPHLGGLWAYGMNNFRYDYNSRFIHPVWSVLMTESGFDQYESGFVYRRKYKTAGVGNEKNVAIALGNLLSIYARNNFSAQKALSFIKKSGMYRDLVGYFRSRGLDKADIKLFIEDGLTRRRLASKLAA